MHVLKFRRSQCPDVSLLIGIGLYTMTVIVSVKINDGVVMASDSTSSFAIGQNYHHANKIVNLRKGLPIGAMITGYGNIGNESLETLFKDLRRRFSGEDQDHLDWMLDLNTYDLSGVAARVREFLFEEKAQGGQVQVYLQVRICGYSSGRPLAEVWQVALIGSECDAPLQVQAEDSFGPRWDGEYEALNRLILGTPTKFADAVIKFGFLPEQAQALDSFLPGELTELIYLPAMPMQDAIDLARFMVEVTSNFIKFSVKRSKTVGGAVEIAAITKHEGFKWVQRKHFYSNALNPSA
jgi:hypothetical protein